MPDALAHMRALLPALLEGDVPLGRFLPGVGKGGAAPLQRRAALASTLLAGLELSRDGVVTLEQEAAFKAIRLSPAVVAGSAAQSLDEVAG